ncbi:MMS19 nucleotide excision repair protein homolog [Thrips palmi]|uniref:MMS19 nucleotide excision repair protein n=1 Tax=Thrips palmi TaxID=161013 RepID=A0A6P8Z376_THRPL|nr:MMS19 nucleotide excision repair protein homolog [Thrips palmi]
MAAPWDKETLCQAIKEDPAFCTSCPSVSAEILARRLPLVKLVEFLKDLLTDPEPSQRAQGILVLSSALRDLPADFLREDEVRFIIEFFCDRLKDHHDVIPAALKGILTIISMKNFPKELPSQILSTLMLNITCQSQRQEDRRTIYRILDALVVPHYEDLKCMGPDLVYHIITSIDGERDPRNLNYLFSMLPAILRTVSLGHLTEDFFEVMACYFPVDFQPAAADPNQISREKLAFGLSECLTAIPEFCEFSIPLLLEKLDSSLRLAKLDSLQLLMKGCVVFHPNDLAVHLIPIWMSLSREVLNGLDSEVKTAAREALTILLRNLAELPSDVAGQLSPMRQLLGDVISASVSALGQVQTALFMPSLELLLAAAKSCREACQHVLTTVFPLFIDNFKGKTEVGDKTVYLCTMSRFLAVCKELKVTPERIPDISVQWSSIVQLFFQAAKHDNPTLRKEALVGLTILGSTLNEVESKNLFNLLCEMVDGENSKEVRDHCTLCLKEMASFHSHDVIKHVLAEKLNITDVQREDVRFERHLAIQCSLAALQPFSELILPNVIDLVVLSHDEHQAVCALTHLRVLLEESQNSNSHVFECLHKCDFVLRVIKWWFSSIDKVNGPGFVNSDAILSEMCHVISAVMRNLNQREQTLVHEKTEPLFKSSTKDDIRAVDLLEAVLGYLHPGVVLNETRVLCPTLAFIAIFRSEPKTVVSASRLLASLINKIPDENLLNEILADVSKLQDEVIGKDNEQAAVQSTALLGWVIKGLAMRGHRQLESWIDKLINLVGDSRNLIALSAAGAFEVIMAESPVFLNRESYCVIRLLYRQRVFVGSLKLIKTSRMVPIEQRSPYLMAFTNLLSGVPHNVLHPHLKEVLPMLLESLSQKSVLLLQAALDALRGLLVDENFSNELRDQIQSIVPRLLPLAANQDSIAVRRMALNCMVLLSKLPTELLLPFRNEVIIGLESCLNDPKRLVRRDAVVALSRWTMMDAPRGK